MTGEPVDEWAAAGLSLGDADELAHDLARTHRQLAAAAAVGRAGVLRAEAVAAASELAPGPAPAGPAPVRWGWRRSLRFGLERGMWLPRYLPLYARYLEQRLRHPHVDMRGLVFFGRRVELHARRHHGRLRLGPWCWIGDGTRLRCHEGNLRLAPKVVMGCDVVVNAYLDVEIGQNTLLGDWLYVCDFDHNHDRVDVPIKRQGLAKTPVRIGEDVWVGEKASILRGADIGSGSVIASQSLVKGHIPPFSIAVGSPARVVRSRLPKGMTPEEALDLQHRGRPIPGDPMGG
ncbi:MAG TPA: acyltransferase [Egibacteraceae bacterium]|nr:acyltransferase [Egibacteraceae bacterium]